MAPPSIPTVEQRQEQSVRIAIAQCERINGQLVERYDINFDAWKIEVEAGKRNNKNPPQPPFQWFPSAHADGFTYESLSYTTYVCEPRLDIPEDHSQPQAPPPQDGDTRKNVPPGDVMPVGYIAYDARTDTRWVKKSSVTPFGTAYYYERLD